MIKKESVNLTSGNKIGGVAAAAVQRDRCSQTMNWKNDDVDMKGQPLLLQSRRCESTLPCCGEVLRGGDETALGIESIRRYAGIFAAERRTRCLSSLFVVFQIFDGWQRDVMSLEGGCG